MRSGVHPVEGAELYYEVRGSGPALLMISGAGGDAGYTAAAADLLADAFTVISYDRRGNSRSTGRVDTPMTFDQQADDARALIEAVAGGKAIVFGNSQGASIAMALAARHPAAVAGLIAHEPPAVRVLDDAERWLAFFDDVSQTFEREGGLAAITQFVQKIRGEGSYDWPDELTQRFMGNVDHLFKVEWKVIGTFEPDVQALKAAPFPIVMAAGAEDRGEFYARPSVVIAQRIGAAWVEFPGIHLESVARPAIFAAALRVVATGMCTQTAGIPKQWSHAPV